MTLAEAQDLRKRIVQEATEWIGTPYVDGQGLKRCGVDCAYYLLRVYQSVGLIPKDFKPPRYSPQKWLNSPSQTDKLHLRFEDRTFLDIVLRFSDHEIFSEGEIQPGDLMLVKVIASWTHGGIIIDWPTYVLHSLKGNNVCGAHGTKEGFWSRRDKRFFSMLPVPKEMEWA
jgi:cell wall-associated NlpC family hydrolase